MKFQKDANGSPDDEYTAYVETKGNNTAQVFVGSMNRSEDVRDHIHYLTADNLTELINALKKARRVITFGSPSTKITMVRDCEDDVWECADDGTFVCTSGSPKSEATLLRQFGEGETYSSILRQYGPLSVIKQKIKKRHAAELFDRDGGKWIRTATERYAYVFEDGLVCTPGVDYDSLKATYGPLTRKKKDVYNVEG